MVRPWSSSCRFPPAGRESPVRLWAPGRRDGGGLPFDDGNGHITWYSSGGTAFSSVIRAGGLQNVSSDGSASGTLVEDGGIQTVLKNGIATETDVRSGGLLTISNGGTAWNPRVQDGGTLSLLNGGMLGASSGHVLAWSAEIGFGSRLAAAVGGTVSAARIGSGGLLAVSGGSVAGAVIMSGGSQAVLSGGRASGTLVRSGGIQAVASAGRTFGTLVERLGRQRVQSGGTASGTQLLAEGMALVYGGGTVQDISVAGGRIVLRDGASAGGVLLESRDAVTGTLDLQGGGTLSISCAGNLADSILLDESSFVSICVSGMAAWQAAPCLSLSEENVQWTGQFSVSVAKAQTPGRYALVSGLEQDSDAFWSVSAGGSAVQARLDGTATSAGGMDWSLQASGAEVFMDASVRKGWMKRGNGLNNALAGDADGDVFWGGDGGNDVISENGGWDCAVYGTEHWGRYRIAETDGTMCIVFSGLSKSEIASSLRNGVMTFAKKADRMQRITVSGWSSETHSAVFASGMSAFGAWTSAASPILAQAKDARAEVWRAAGLAAA